MSSNNLGRLPVTVVTGFLGAGKSTLLRQLLLHSGLRLAVLVNEFGEVGIDGDLIRSCGFCPEDEAESRVVELANGCLCCTVQDEFLPTMQTLLQRADQLDGIVVETSGLALPLPLVQAFQWPEIRTKTRVTGVVTVVDGEALAAGSVVGDPAALLAQQEADPSLDHLADLDDLFSDQLQAADLVLVSRGDLLDDHQLATVRGRLLDGLRPGVEVLPMQRGSIPAALLFGLDREAEHHDHDQHGHEHGHEGHHHDHDHHDHTHVAMQSASLCLSGSFDRSSLELALRQQIEQQSLLRLKGRAWFAGKPHPLQIQAVGPRLECWFDPHTRAAARPPEPGLEVVALGLSLDEPAFHRALQALLG